MPFQFGVFFETQCISQRY